MSLIHWLRLLPVGTDGVSNTVSNDTQFSINQLEVQFEPSPGHHEYS